VDIGADPRPDAGLQPVDLSPAPDLRPAVDLGPQPDPDLGPQPDPDLGPRPDPDLGPQPDPDLGPQPDPDLGPQPDPLEPEWERCPGEAVDLECTTVQVPLDWREPLGRRIDYRIRRIRPRRERAGQLWLLQGGPGAPGDALIEVGRFFADQLGDLAVYVPDHRGTGGSQWLGCRDAQSSLDPGCLERLRAEWGEELVRFSVSMAARDVGELIEVERVPGERVLVWGVSYGTFLVNRYLHLYPGQADAIMLDSSCPPDTCPAVNWDRNFDAIGTDYLEGCGEAPDVAERLGPEPVARLAELYAALDDGHCPDVTQMGLGRDGLKLVFAVLLRYEEVRTLIPVILHRVLRCGGDDRAAMAALVRALDWLGGEPDPGDSDVLAVNIFHAEFWPGDPSPEELARIHDELLISDGGSVGLAQMVRDWPWPPYWQDPAWEQWGPLLQPALLLNGTLDPQTPHFLLASAQEHFRGPTHHYLEVPGAPHGALMYAPGAGGVPCGMQLTLDFLARPEAPLDSSCLRRLPSPSCRAAPEYAEALLGTRDAWDGAPQGWKSMQRLQSLDERALRPLRELGRSWRRGRPTF